LLLPLALAAPFAAGPLSGRVVDPQARPVAGATVVAVGATSAPLSTKTDADGRFTFAGLTDGAYDLTATAPGLLGDAHASVGGSDAASVEIALRVSAMNETLVVSAAQIDQPLSRTADSVTIIPGDDIAARQISTLGEALRTVPGFTIAQNGGPGTVTSIFPRGGESDYTLVLIDGVRANDFGGGADLSQVPIADVERIEVVRGPQSALYGADAIGGVVQIITRHSGMPMAAGRIEGGSWATRRVVGSTSGESGGVRWQGGGDYFRDDGFTGLVPGSSSVHVANDDSRERQAWGGAGWRGAQGTDLFGTFRYVDTDRGSPGPYGSDPAHRYSGVDLVSRGTTDRRAGGLRLVQPWTGPASRVRQRVEFDVADYDLQFVDSFGTSESQTRRYHGRIQTDAAINAAVGVSGGVEWLKESATNTFIVSGTETVPVDRTVIGTFGEARWTASDRLNVQAGVRAEHITRQQLAGDPSSFSPRPDFADDTVVSINPKLSASWVVSPALPSGGAHAWTRVHAAGGTGIRPPDAFEIAFTDNPNLKPERSKSVEVGITQTLSNGAVQIDATTFFNQYDDLIVSVGTLSDASRYRTDNVSNARARGVELSGAWQDARGLSVRASYTFLDTEIRAVDGSAQAPSPYHVGDPLLRRPRHQGSIVAAWVRGRVNAFASLEARGETLDAEPSFGPSGGLYENPGHAIVTLGGGFRIARGVEAYARILNLFDREYEEVFGYPSPGRTAFAGVRIAAGR
jgi:outer membrane cobalamin receptor